VCCVSAILRARQVCGGERASRERRKRQEVSLAYAEFLPARTDVAIEVTSHEQPVSSSHTRSRARNTTTIRRHSKNSQRHRVPVTSHRSASISVAPSLGFSFCCILELDGVSVFLAFFVDKRKLLFVLLENTSRNNNMVTELYPQMSHLDSAIRSERRRAFLYLIVNVCFGRGQHVRGPRVCRQQTTRSHFG
jgi:hypothetical protein